MRDLQLEAALWYLFTSPDFFNAAAAESEKTQEWFGNLAVARGVADLGRNGQIYDAFRSLAQDFRRGAEMAKLQDYTVIWDTARSVSGDVRGVMEQPLRSWMTEAEYREFTGVKISRLLTYAGQIKRSLNNAMVGANSYFNTDPDYPERRDDDDGFPGDEIVEWFLAYRDFYKEPLFWKLPEPSPKYAIDTSIACHTGAEVPWTGVWFPATGMEKHSLTFAIKGSRMQAAYKVVKTADDLEAEGVVLATAETIAVSTVWYPIVLVSADQPSNGELQAKAGDPCPRQGVWQPADINQRERTFNAGDTMDNLGSAYGLTVWRWLKDH